eukprot:13384217-Alexandrium_andersonii.AAC.1
MKQNFAAQWKLPFANDARACSAFISPPGGHSRSPRSEFRTQMPTSPCRRLLCRPDDWWTPRR